MVCRRSSTVRALNSTPSAANTVGSGQNVTVVPVRSRVDFPIASNFVCGLPPLANSCR